MPNTRFSLYFSDDYGPHAPEGPGWYLFGTTETSDGPTEIIPHVRISGKQAIVLGKVIDKQAEGKPLNWSETPGLIRGDVGAESAIITSNEAARELIAGRVAEAEALAARIEQLRARGEEFDS